MFDLRRLKLGAALTASIVLPAIANAGPVSSSSNSGTAMKTGGVDFATARPMPLPQVAGVGVLKPSSSAQVDVSRAGFVTGNTGSVFGVRAERVPVAPLLAADTPAPQEWGTSEHPFSTSRVDHYQEGFSYRYPNAPSGKLFFNIDGGTFVCSASLIKPGVVVTAAHCVAGFGAQQFYTDFEFIPAYYDGNARFGTWTATDVFVMTSYYDGSDPCWASAPGVICQNDVAVMVLDIQNHPAVGDYYVGIRTGWYGYGWDGYGFSGTGLTHVTQLGYPVSHDSGARMQRNGSYGYVDAVMQGNTIIGTRMTGGSSGGPWLNNFGEVGSLSGTGTGTSPESNVVMGVTSWGYVDTTVKQQGASPFTSGNIIPLVDAACTNYPDRC